MPSGTATANPAGSINRITKEIANIQKGSDLSLAVAYREADVRSIRGLIIGPPESPYEFGFFEFDIRFPRTYPIDAPTVKCITTNAGRTRFNPNIYAQGKVCLSILGTWRGESGEQWSSAQGLESILLSIQSLMSSNPYENEPGFEEYGIENKDANEYARKIRHETLRIAVIERMERILEIDSDRAAANGRSSRARAASKDDDDSDTSAGAKDTGDVQTPATEPAVYEYDAELSYSTLDLMPWDPFADLIKRRFLWYYDSYMRTIDAASREQKDGKAFPLTPFEYNSNTMAGSYQYLNLKARLERIRAALADECETWRKAGAKQVRDSTQLATQLAFQFKQLKYKWNDSSYPGAKLELSLPDAKNPFAWNLTLFGESSTHLEGGVFNISLTIPPNFPDAWPRVYIETPLFHHRVSSNGNLCYAPTKPEDIGSHLDAIVQALEDKGEPKYDPRALVNPEAGELYWGGEQKRKQYTRKLRRSAEDSTSF